MDKEKYINDKYKIEQTMIGTNNIISAIGDSNSSMSTSINVSDPWLSIDMHAMDGRIAGVYARQSIQPNLTLPHGLILYAPTLKTPNSPIELSTIYWNEGDRMLKGLGIWDFNYNLSNNIGFNKIIPMSTMIDKYSTKTNRAYYYDICTSRYDNRWCIFLFNFKNNNWEKIYDIPNPINAGKWGDHGWDTFETKNFNGLCPALPKIETSYLQVYDTGGFDLVNNKRVYTEPGWYSVDKKYGWSAGKTNLCNYNMEMIPYNHWSVESFATN